MLEINLSYLILIVIIISNITSITTADFINTQCTWQDNVNRANGKMLKIQSHAMFKNNNK